MVTAEAAETKTGREGAKAVSPEDLVVQAVNQAEICDLIGLRKSERMAKSTNDSH